VQETNGGRERERETERDTVLSSEPPTTQTLHFSFQREWVRERKRDKDIERNNNVSDECSRYLSLYLSLFVSFSVFVRMSLYLYHGVFLFLHLSFTLGFPTVAACMCVGAQSALLRDMELSVKPTSKT
jgi:hypothetical protein